MATYSKSCTRWDNAYEIIRVFSAVVFEFTNNVAMQAQIINVISQGCSKWNPKPIEQVANNGGKASGVVSCFINRYHFNHAACTRYLAQYARTYKLTSCSQCSFSWYLPNREILQVDRFKLLTVEGEDYFKLILSSA